MVEEREIITFLLGLAVLAYMYLHREEILRLPSSRLLFASFTILLAGWLMTILESFFWPDILHLLEHIAYMASSVVLATWCWILFRNHCSQK